MSSAESSPPPVKKEPMTEFQRLCYSVLGRVYMRNETSWQSCSTVFLQVFADLVQLQRPWWRICSLSGFFFFRSHVLLNFERTKKAISVEKDVFEDFLQREGYLECEIPVGLAKALKHVADDEPNEWNLYEIPDTEDAHPDSQKLRQLMQAMKCSDIHDFDEWHMDHPVKVKIEHPVMDFESFEIANQEPNADGEERRAMMSSPGEFYRNLVPKERAQNDQCWLFRTLEQV